MGTVIHTGAVLAGLVPRRFGFKQFVPVRPGAALQGSDRIDGAGGFAFFALEENAIAAGLFGETVAHADAAEMLGIEPAICAAEERGDFCDFVLGGPYVAGRAAAAIAALRAGELETISVPLGFHGESQFQSTSNAPGRPIHSTLGK